MQGAWRVYLISALLSCVVGAATAFITVRLLVPAPAQSPLNTVTDSPAAQSLANTVVLEGVVEVPLGKEPEEMYKAPFAAPPHLTFPDGLNKTCEVTDQKAGSFKLRRATTVPLDEPAVAKVKWKAEGQAAK
jgi:hypothetical protein